jgi:hypothetical protein
MNIPTFLEGLESSGLASWIRDSLYAFPLIESCHVIGLTMVFGTIAVVDLRLLGLAWTQRPFSRVAGDIFRWTWVAFALTVTTGLLMFITNARVYFDNAQFRSKMLVIGLSGLNMLIFELTTGRNVSRWDTNKSAPPAGRLAGALSILLWISVIFLGRWIGFTSTANTTPAPDINLDNLFH